MNPTATYLQPNQTIDRTVLDNGITVISSTNSTADLIASRLFLKAGSCWEPREKAGLANLLTAVLIQGTKKLSSVEISVQVESVGASLGLHAAADYLVISLQAVSADFASLLQLAGEIMRTPTFPEAEVELKRHLTIQSIRSQQEQPFNVAFRQLRQAMYKDHPYGISVIGTEATVSRLKRKDLQQYYQTYFRPDNLIVSFSGHLTHSDALDLTERVFGDWQVPARTIPTLKLPPITSQPSQEITVRDTRQSLIMLGYLASSVQNDDYIALNLLNTYLGNGISSRLFVQLREKRGLAYDVSAFYPTCLDNSQFIVYTETAPENTAVALEVLRTEVERLCYEHLTSEELQIAKNKLLGQYALGKQANAEIAQLFGWYEALDLGIEFDTEFQQAIAQVTPEIAKQVAYRYFSKSPYISLVGPFGAQTLGI